MNLTVMISGSCDYLALPYTSPLNQVTPPYELLETSLEHPFVTKLEKVNKQANSSIINKFKNNYINGGYNRVKPK